MLDPVVHDLCVAEGAEAAEEFARDAAHFRPGGVGIDFLKDGADGTATADGDAEVVNGVGRGIFADGLELLDDALHGFAEVALRDGSEWDGDDGRQCLLTSTRWSRIYATLIRRLQRSDHCCG